MTTSIIKENKTENRPLSTLLWGGAALLFWLGVWTAAALLVNQELLVPTPWRVAAVLFEKGGTLPFWRAAGATLLRIAAGFLAGAAGGCLLAVLTARWRVAERLLAPFLRVVRATPVASFIILAFVWLHTDVLPGFIAFLMVMPVVWGNVDKGLRETDPALLEMAKVFRFGRKRTWLHVRLPAVMPYFLSGCTTALGLSWKSGVAAEVICRPLHSIGGLLQTAKNHLETPEVFAYTIAVILLSVLLEQVFVRLIRRLGRRYNAR